jgi:nucleotide-binding universal stress UspA family protein
MNILVTTDGSAAAGTILPHAAAFARATSAGLLLVRVLHPRIDARDEMAPTIAEAAQRVAERWNAEMQALLSEAGIDATPLTVIKQRGEEIDQAIVRTAHEQEAGLLAMHSRGTGALRHAVVGSVTMGAVGKSGLPVMVTTRHAEPPRSVGPYRLVITNDGSEAAKDAARAMAPLIETGTMEAALLQVYVPRLGDAGEAAELHNARRSLEELRMLLKLGPGVQVLVETAREREKVEAAILRAAQGFGASAIAISTHGHSARRHLFAGSVALALLGKSPLPLILARAAK